MNAPANTDHSALCSIELEQEILGAVLVTNSALEIIEREISAEDFSEPTHRAIFETIVGVYRTRGIVSLALIIAAMGGDKNAILAEGVTLGVYVAR